MHSVCRTACSQLHELSKSNSKKKRFSGFHLLKSICDALGDLVPFVQFKKREKHPWGSANHVF